MIGVARARPRLMGESIRRTKLMGNCKPTPKAKRRYDLRAEALYTDLIDHVDSTFKATGICDRVLFTAITGE
tara:strand:+ start:1478 stop:1693 length:216 start_codon:yes stop_codon:yes gene_type:complete